jgi:hypothetical protein
MHILVAFKGKSVTGFYYWERVNELLPKQLITRLLPKYDGEFPMKHQLYIIYFSRISGNELIGATHITNYVETCNIWKRVGNDLMFKTTKNKGFLVSEYAACFPYNKEEEKWFVKYLVGIYKKSYNVYTKSNVLYIFNKYITYCEVFGDDKSSVIIIGKGKHSLNGTDITKVPKSMYIPVRNRLEHYIRDFINPNSQRNCKKWIEYLDNKFKKQ